MMPRVAPPAVPPHHAAARVPRAQEADGVSKQMHDLHKTHEEADKNDDEQQQQLQEEIKKAPPAVATGGRPVGPFTMGPVPAVATTSTELSADTAAGEQAASDRAQEAALEKKAHESWVDSTQQIDNSPPGQVRGQVPRQPPRTPHRVENPSGFRV